MTNKSWCEYCYLKDEKNFLLIDCGETVFSKLKEYDLINKSYEKFIKLFK